MAHFHNNALIGASGQGGYQIERSLRFNSADSAYLNRTPASAGNRKTWTWSGWVKRSGLGTTQRLFNAYSGDENNTTEVGFNSSNQIEFSNVISGTQGNGFFGTTSAVFRDTSAWYHIVYAIDTTQSTAAAALKVYVNGVQQTLGGSSYGGGANHNTFVNNTNVHRIGQTAPPNSGYFNGYLTEIHFIDGQALTPSSFGETDTITGVWKPKKYAGTYGTNGFYLKFADNSGTTSTTLGKDSSGNGNNWTPNNFSVTAGAGNDSMIDTPTPYADGGNGRGNYCTLNPLDSTATLSNGNLTQTATAERNSRSTFQIPSSGLWYAEATATSTTNATTISCGFGIATASANLSANPYNLASAWNLYSSNFAYINRNGTPTASLGYTLTAGDVIQIAVDPANNRAWIGRNNTWYNSTTGTTGDPAGGTNPTVSSLPAGLFVFANTFNQTWDVNFGQRAFAYTPPSGFLALNTQNLPEPSIKKPSSYFDTLLYTGNSATSSAGTTARTLSGLGFQPDLIWVKSRNNGGTWSDHSLTDTVRGANLSLSSNTTGTETNVATGFSQGGVGTSTSDGFTIVSGTAGGTTNLNSSSGTYVAWCWDESATPGFDIVTYSGNGASPRSINHSLGVAPSFVVVKNRTTSGYEWPCYHTSLGTGKVIWLQLTNEADLITNRAYGGIDSVSSTTFTVKSGGTNGANVNANGDNYVAYLWSEVAGFSKFGSYTGNGSTDGTFVFCGFRPALILMKRTDSAGESWSMWDNRRIGYNAAQYYLAANSASTEDSTAPGVNSNGGPDFLSNGFKMRSYNGSSNNSGGTYIFAAFAESPFKYSLAR